MGKVAIFSAQNASAIAQGSGQELETQVLIAFRLKYLNDHEKTELLGMLAEVGRLLAGLSRSLRGIGSG